MSDQTSCCASTRIAAYTVSIVGCFVVIAAIVRFVHQHNPSVAVNQERAAERAKALVELKQANSQLLTSYGWQDKTKGIAHIPVTEAIKIAEREWKNPAQAKAKLSELAEKAFAVPPPPSFE